MHVFCMNSYFYVLYISIHLADFEIGSSSLTTSPGQGLTFTATDISIAVSADWSYKIW